MVVLWASAFPAIRVAAPEMGVVGLSIARLGIASVALLIIAPTFPPSISGRLVFVLLSTMLILIIVRAFQLQREKRRENAAPAN